MHRYRGKPLFHWAERRISHVLFELEIPNSRLCKATAWQAKFEIAQWRGAHVIALGAIFAQRDGDFMGARH